jgi:hypothetical protein
MTGHELATRMLDATPLPPEDATVEALIAAFATVRACRQAILDEALQVTITEPADRARFAELAARDAAWRDALNTALSVVAAQRLGVTKLRRYAL